VIRLLSALLLALSLTLSLSVAAFAVAVDEKPLEDPALEAEARALMKDIRCLVCQNQSIEDSNADLAKDLRQIVRERIALGDTPANVRSYLVDRYGDWVLLEPPVKKSTYFLWGSPFIFLGLLAFFILRSRRPQAPAAPLSAEEEAKLKSILGEEEQP
jgi:cytochrome c-type biogenesis protein CcmH